MTQVTTAGDPVCNFTTPPGKQPFEQILFGSRHVQHYSSIPSEKLIVSIPSALHSHKPPLQGKCCLIYLVYGSVINQSSIYRNTSTLHSQKCQMSGNICQISATRLDQLRIGSDTVPTS